MPALPSVPNVLRAQVLWDVGTDTDVSTGMFFRYSGGPVTLTIATSLAQAVANAWAQFETPPWSSDVTLAGAKVTDLSSPTGGEGTSSADQPGGDASGGLAGGTCTVVGFHIARRYRGGKPRVYLPWGSKDNLNGPNAWAAAYVTQVTTYVTEILSQVVGSTAGGVTITDHVNVSYYEGTRVVTSPTTGRARNVPILRTTPLVDDIAGFTVLAYPGSQRRRNRS